MKSSFIYVTSLCLVFLTGCLGEDPTTEVDGGVGSPRELSVPKISTFSPLRGRVGDEVIISGAVLDGATSVSFNGIPAQITVNLPDTIITSVPEGVTTGKIQVETPNGTVETIFNFTLDTDPQLLPPTISSVSPGKATIGSTITINGTNLISVNAVTIGGLEVKVESRTETAIEVTVPLGLEFGPTMIIVQTAGGMVETGYEILPSITITSVDRISAVEGETITITGSFLDQVTSAKIAGVDATLGNKTLTSLEIIIPAVSALGLVTIEINDGFTTFTTSTDLIEFYAITVMPDFGDTYDNPDTTYLTERAGGEVTLAGFSDEVQAMATPGFFPNGIPNQGRFFYVEGVSDGTSGSFDGQIEHAKQDAGFFTFFEGDSPEDYWFNAQINFGGVPSNYSPGDPLAGFRVRFDEGVDTDDDGSSSDEYMHFRPTLDNLAAFPLENGWYTISVNLNDFIGNNEDASWNDYDLTQATRLVIVFRRTEDGPFALSFDNIFITRGGPYNFFNE